MLHSPPANNGRVQNDVLLVEIRVQIERFKLFIADAAQLSKDACREVCKRC